jgi:hypothetical protein
MASTTSGSRNGRYIGSVSAGEFANVCESAVLDAVTADAARVSPISIEPESPMKIRAGEKLCGRKPRQAPASTAVSSEGANATSPYPCRARW